ncbi:MAG TPA: hypothetical protein VME20_13080 [Acidimicrobiales bacterium]|nr:hypothetical protein [Acidimicrobiales bacterium]
MLTRVSKQSPAGVRGPAPRRPRARAWHVVASGLAAFLAALMALSGIAPAARILRPVTVPPVEVEVSGHRDGSISRYLFGANLLWPYNAEGAFDASSDDFYPSFIEDVRSLGITALRYPAGTTSDSFDWLRAIGPEARRQPNEPYGMQAAGKSRVCCILDNPVPSTVGPDEFGRLLADLGAIGTITVNFVTGNATEAAEFVAYMTTPYSRHAATNPGSPGYWAALRAKYGHPAPYDVPYWEVGNEQDGPGQYGWRAGRIVEMGRHKGNCNDIAVCLYAFGGTTSFSDQGVGALSDDELSASFSTGEPGQSFYVYFPPVVRGSQTVFVDGHRWAPIKDLGAAGRGADVYTFDPATGEILFGNGKRGAIPPVGQKITVSYESGPHDGFVEFYAAMKKVNPHIKVCEAEEENTVFLQIMGRAHRYDCVELHKYAKPMDLRAPLAEYEEDLMAYPLREGREVGMLQEATRHYSGRDVPIILSEYGQLVVPMPDADPDFNLSLDEGILIASQLRQWALHHLPLAEKYLLNSIPFLGEYRLSSHILSSNINAHGLSVDSAMIAGPAPFIIEPTGEAVRLMSQLAGTELLSSHVVDGLFMHPRGQPAVPVLQSLAALSPSLIDILVINTSPLTSVKAEVTLDGLEHGSNMLYSLLHGPNALAYNTLEHPDAVTTTTHLWRLGAANSFWWDFPAHSVTLLQVQLTRR